jgi:predicted Ser/Thr protein kinase
MAEQLIGNYRVLKQIGAGGMAKVYLAVHKDIPNLKVILKILSDPRLVQRFKQEADKLALLDGHPNICRIKHFFTHGDDVVIAMEFIDGVTLDEKLKAEGRMAIGDSVRIVSDVLDILQYAHQRGIFHRDIKPSNIMIDRSGTVKIIDFGIAKGESDPSLTIAGTACGTPAYMAPEQFTPSEKTNYALIDVYAVGTTLYRMLTGELPFKGDNEFALRDAKLFTDPVTPRSLASGIPRELESCILRSLEKEPGHRYQSAEEMRTALTAAVGDRQIRDVDLTHDISVGQPKVGRKRPVTGIVGAAVAALVIALGIWYGLGSDEPAPPQVSSPLAPADGEVFTNSAIPTLTWTETAGESGSYIIEYAGDSSFADGRTIAGVRGGSFTFGSELPNSLYAWRVYAVGADGLRSGPSPPRTFTIEVTPQSPSQGKLTIEVNPRGDIYVDGELIDRRQNRIETALDTGRHLIRVTNQRSRQKAFVDTVHLAADQTLTRTYRFSFPPPPEPKPSLGEVRVGSRPRGADIYIDGALQPQKTNYTFSLTPGRHIVRSTLLMEGNELERVDTIQVVADSTHKVIFDFE